MRKLDPEFYVAAKTVISHRETTWRFKNLFYKNELKTKVNQKVKIENNLSISLSWPMDN